jgi:hypothetical protein
LERVFNGREAISWFLSYCKHHRIVVNREICIPSHVPEKILVDLSPSNTNFAPADLFTIMPVIANSLKRAVLAIVVSFDGFMHDLFVQKAKRYNLQAENFECFSKAKNWLVHQ